jgi:hypothetical protein
MLDADVFQAQKSGKVIVFLLFHEDDIKSSKLSSLLMVHKMKIMIEEQVIQSFIGLIDRVNLRGFFVVALLPLGLRCVRPRRWFTVLSGFIRRMVFFIFMCHAVAS